MMDFDEQLRLAEEISRQEYMETECWRRNTITSREDEEIQLALAISRQEYERKEKFCLVAIFVPVYAFYQTGQSSWQRDIATSREDEEMRLAMATSRQEYEREQEFRRSTTLRPSSWRRDSTTSREDEEMQRAIAISRQEFRRPVTSRSLYSSVGRAQTRQSSQNECQICCEKSVDTQLECTHSFCHDCIFRWMQEKPECPVCRRAIGINL